MKIVSMKCPNCGGTVKITDNQNACICPYCDSALTIDDGKFHIVDEAKIKEIEFEKQKYQDRQKKEGERKERREAWRKKCRQWVLIELVLFLITFILAFIFRRYFSYILLYIGMSTFVLYGIGVIAGPIYLAITRPDVDYDKDNPPAIKSKWWFGIVLFFAAYFITAIAFGTVLAMLEIN